MAVFIIIFRRMHLEQRIMASHDTIPYSSNGSGPMQAQSLFDDRVQHPELAEICISTRRGVTTCLYTMLLLNPDNLIDLMSMLVLADTIHLIHWVW